MLQDSKVIPFTHNEIAFYSLEMNVKDWKDQPLESFSRRACLLGMLSIVPVGEHEMKTEVRHEIATLLLIFAATGLVFWETSHDAILSNGQISSGAFPRLAAGAMGVFAMLRALLLLTGAAGLRLEERLSISWENSKRPIAVAAAMSVYVLLFGVVPFFLLTLVFLVVVFFIFGIRPWKNLAVQALLISTFLFVLFAKLLQIAV